MVLHVRLADEANGRIEIFLYLLVTVASSPTLVVGISQANAIGRVIAFSAVRTRLLIKARGLHGFTPGQARIAVQEIRADQIVVQIGLRIAMGRNHSNR